MESPYARLRAIGAAVLVAGLLLVISRQITAHGWYAANGAYRAQVDAFLQGRLALSRAPEAIQHDFAWTGSGVQQVWGLGVAMWMTPFELFGRVIGLTPFPDRVALLVWIAASVFLALRAWRDESWWVRAGSVGATVLLPAFVTLVRGRLGVYEEAAAYSYGAAMILLGALACFAKQPTRARYLALVAIAGLGGFVRPTVWFYGLATAIVASAMWRRRRDLVLGAVLFTAGGGALYATNAARFGSGMEFGHRLNLEALPGNLYATRFSYPFERVGVIAAGEELVGSFFGQPERHPRTTFYGKHLHVMQSEVPRWREYYFTTFSWPYVPLLVLGIVLAWRRRDGPWRWLAAWAAIGGVPLLAFYLRSPSVSSRYQMDLAPAFAAVLLVVWQWAARRRWVAPAFAAGWLASVMFARAAPRLGVEPIGHAAAAEGTYAISRAIAHERTLPAAYDLADPWLVADTDIAESFVRCVDETGAAIDPDATPIAGDVCARGERKPDDEQWQLWTTQPSEPPPVCAPEAPECELDPGDVIATYFPPPALYLNAFRWNLETGEMPRATFVWTSDPQFFEIDARGPDGTDWTRAIQVAIGAQHLRLAAVADTGTGVRLRFESTAPLPRGLAIAFLAFGDDAAIDQIHTPFAVTRMRWRN